MRIRQRVTGLFFLLMTGLSFPVPAQNLSVEDIYLQQSMEIQVIRDLGADASRDMKTMALDYIGEMVERGNTNDEIRRILADLTLDGVRNQVRLDGRVINNFPDLRIRAVNYLAQIGTPEAKASLLDILKLSVQASSVDEDPSVITATINGLAKIGLNDDGDTLRGINAVFLQYDTLKPDNTLAQAVVTAIDSFIEKGIKDKDSLNVLISIQMNYAYIKVVRAKASAVATKLLGT